MLLSLVRLIWIYRMLGPFSNGGVSELRYYGHRASTVLLVLMTSISSLSRFCNPLTVVAA